MKLFTTIAALLVLCSISPIEEHKASDPVYGGTINVALNKSLVNPHPPRAYAVQDIRVTNQVFEGLLRFDPYDLKPSPAIAHSWQLSADRLTYTFNLRTNVKFHDDKCFKNGIGRFVTATDIKYCFEQICTESRENLVDWIFTDDVVGAKEYLEATEYGDDSVKEVKGIKVVNDSVLIIQLSKPNYNFTHRLALPTAGIYPKEAVELYGKGIKYHLIGTGPFKQAEHQQGVEITLVKNEDYWDTDMNLNPLPYLDGVNFYRHKTPEKMVESFKAGDIDVCAPKHKDLHLLMEGKELKNEFDNVLALKCPQLFSSFYGFAHHHGIFQNADVRRAFNYAVDRDKLVEEAYEGRAIAAIHGLIPPNVDGYDHTKTKGYNHDPEKAKALFAKAGYPNGEGFPPITLNINTKDAPLNMKAALCIQRDLRDNLNVEVIIDVRSFAEHLAIVEDGEAVFWRDSWMPDYGTPDNFLLLLHGSQVPANKQAPSQTNSTRYRNLRFDSIYNSALSTANLEERNNLLQQAEQQAIDDAAIMPLWYLNSYVFMNKQVAGLMPNGYDTYYFREVYKQP